jgi:hypothetical protein
VILTPTALGHVRLAHSIPNFVPTRRPSICHPIHCPPTDSAVLSDLYLASHCYCFAMNPMWFSPWPARSRSKDVRITARIVFVWSLSPKFASENFSARAFQYAEGLLPLLKWPITWLIVELLHPKADRSGVLIVQLLRSSLVERVPQSRISERRSLHTVYSKIYFIRDNSDTKIHRFYLAYAFSSSAAQNTSGWAQCM